MKFLLLCFFALTQVKVSHAQITPSALAGSWKFQQLKAEYPKDMQGKKLADAKKDMKGDEKKFKSFAFSFTEDGHCTIGPIHGTWVMSEDGTTVTVTNEKNEKIVATIMQLTEHQLVFSRMDDGIKQTFTLTK